MTKEEWDEFFREANLAELKKIISLSEYNLLVIITSKMRNEGY